MLKGRNYYDYGKISLNQHAINLILEDNQYLYLCGVEFSRYLDPETNWFRRLQNYLEDDLSYECSALAMIALRGVPTTKIVQGLITENDTIFRHAWVEFTFGHEDFVADPAWNIPFVVPKELYKKHFDLIEPKWFCDYNTFWSYPLSESLYKCMKTRATSEGVFEALEEYGKSYDITKEDYGFMSGVGRNVPNPDLFCPYKRNGKPLSSSILEEFVTRPWLTEPTQETTDLAEALIDVINSL